jgi:hypothetical protein
VQKHLKAEDFSLGREILPSDPPATNVAKGRWKAIDFPQPFRDQ